MPNRVLHDLNTRYAQLHTAKEDLFWSTKMGLAENAGAEQRAFDRAEIELQRFLKDPARLQQARAELAGVQADPAANADEVTALCGWVATFEAHVLESPQARSLFEELVEDEGRLQRARNQMPLGYADAGGFTRATSVRLATMLLSETEEARRRAAWEGLAAIEPYVLQHGFLPLVGKRNQLGRSVGGEDFYDGTVRRVERMSKREIFELLDELEERTREPARRAVAELAARHGSQAVQPWNFLFFALGDATKALDPYFPFASAIGTWGRAFAGLGIGFRGATLLLDLVDRQGKYENGFMHGPEVAWRTPAGRARARIHFTANALPGMVGAGERAHETLFHEGGHAAHFANIDMPAPCFGQEFAPTSVAFAETQSMFCDSLLHDGDFCARYARTREGTPMPAAVLERALQVSQPFLAWQARRMLSVCYGERAIYELPERERTPERVLAELRAVEKRLLFLERAPRPTLAVPHLLAGESSAYYHGYVLAEMAVHQTRAHFLQRDGHLIDNPQVGPELAREYWREGNARSFRDYVARLTRQPLSARAFAEHANQTVEQACAEMHRKVAREPSLPRFEGAVELDATIKVVHGRETVAELEPGQFDAFSSAFGRFIDRLTPPTSD